MYHHHQQPSYNAHAAPTPPQYAPQYGGWPEPPRQNGPMSPNSFSGSFHRQSSNQYAQYQPYQGQYQQPQYQQYPSQDQQYHHHHSQRAPRTPPRARRTSVQQRWDEYVASEECPEALQADKTYVIQVSSELEQRAVADERIGQLSQQSVDMQNALQAERDRRLKWAQEMIIQSPAACAEVYFAMSKQSNSNASSNSGSGTPSPTSRRNSNAGFSNAHSPYGSSPT